MKYELKETHETLGTGFINVCTKIRRLADGYVKLTDMPVHMLTTDKAIDDNFSWPEVDGQVNSVKMGW